MCIRDRIYEGLFYAMSSVAAAFILSLAVEPLAGKMLGSMFSVSYTHLDVYKRQRWLVVKWSDSEYVFEREIK